MNMPPIINPKVVKLLLWQNVYPTSQENGVSTQQIYYTLKIGEQRFISSVRQDKKGNTYWRFRDYQKSTKNAEEMPTETTAEATVNTAPPNQ
jgi:hypothetical protein